VPRTRANSARVNGPSSSRVRRHPIGSDGDRFTPKVLVSAPPPAPAIPPRPFGELGAADIKHLMNLAADVFSKDSAQHRWAIRKGMSLLLGHLDLFEGQTWQDKWEAAGMNMPGDHISAFAVDDAGRLRISAAVGHAFALRLIQPTLLAFRSYRLPVYADWFQAAHKDPLFDKVVERVERLNLSPRRRNNAVFDVCCVLTVFGISLADLTPEGLLHYAVECRQQGLTRQQSKSGGGFAGTQAWLVLHDMGVLPPGSPSTLWGALIGGQRTIGELVDRFQLKNVAVRDLLVDYITRRSVELDYSTVFQLSKLLAGTFWRTVEEINPEQEDLRLSETTVAEWKKRLLVRADGKARLDIDAPLFAVRAFYLDLHTWAVAEPERWAVWSAPCPIRDTDLRGAEVRRRRATERMAARTRERQPLVPTLAEFVMNRWHQMRALLKAAHQAGPGAEFDHEGTTWRRLVGVSDHLRDDPATAPIRLADVATGEIMRLSIEENTAFWEWAVIDTLRLAGLRIEELTELTHLSVRQYRRPNGEVVALLVVSPSKSDRERVIPMSAELFHVIAQVVRRHIEGHGSVRTCVRYDPHEKLWSLPLPYLFQTNNSGALRAMSSSTAWKTISRAVARLAQIKPEFVGIKFAPHDFRRLFATELVNNGLPIHIGAALLGHLDIQTTRGYVAVFDNDVITHYQQFLQQRRDHRPREEYRDPTAHEWADFQEHFDKRRVELGSCGRPYGTGCAHEHACVRCPMLSIDPRMLPRLDELEEDLVARRARALAEGWRGEVEGIDMTLTFLRGKRSQTRLHQNSEPVLIGLPAPRTGQKLTTSIASRRTPPHR
jgi:integrase